MATKRTRLNELRGTGQGSRMVVSVGDLPEGGGSSVGLISFAYGSTTVEIATSRPHRWKWHRESVVFYKARWRPRQKQRRQPRNTNSVL